MARKVLITGVAGFIASHIADAFIQNNITVIGIDHLKKRKDFEINKKIILHKIDLMQSNELKRVLKKYRPTHIIHHASNLVDVGQSIRYPWKAQVDLLMTSRMLSIAKDAGVQHVLFSSSANVYGQQSILPIKESSSLSPLSPYGLTKTAIEEYLTHYSKRYNIPTTIFRYFNVYGERQSRNSQAIIPTIIRDISHNRLLTINEGTQTRDFIYVKDVALANVLASKHKANGIYNVGSGKQTSVNELVGIISKILRMKPAISYKNRDTSDCLHSQAAIVKIKRDLAWSPRTKLYDGLSATVAYFKNLD